MTKFTVKNISYQRGNSFTKKSRVSQAGNFQLLMTKFTIENISYCLQKKPAFCRQEKIF